MEHVPRCYFSSAWFFSTGGIIYSSVLSFFILNSTQTSFVFIYALGTLLDDTLCFRDILDFSLLRTNYRLGVNCLWKRFYCFLALSVFSLNMNVYKHFVFYIAVEITFWPKILPFNVNTNPPNSVILWHPKYVVRLK